MTDIIRLLPDAVANQIAAGEVIQRPASVVKELVENALDAGASEIQVFVKDAGRTLIRVVDNGCGMSDTDARMCLERHATSKIRSANDLFAIKTMGFRGEAMASIAAVAQVELRSKQHDGEIGTRLLVAASEVILQEPDQCAEGSSITVRNLFFNIPARRKFLKSDQTEFRHITDEFCRIAIPACQVRMKLVHNDTEVMVLEPGNIRQRIVAIFGKNINQQLIPLSVETSIVKLEGFIGKADKTRKSSDEQYFFVNGRYMQHPYFRRAVMMAYENIIQPGTYPSFFVFLTVDPAQIDINIHPTKTEIKFEEEKAVFQIINAAAKESLGKFNIVAPLAFEEDITRDVHLTSTTEFKPPVIKLNPGYNPFENKKSSGYYDKVNQYFEQQKTSPDQWELLYAPLTEKNNDIQKNSIGNEAEYDNHFIQLKERFILTPSKSGLMIIDQNRAHERILFEGLLIRLQHKRSNTQKQLFPEQIELSASDRALLTEISDDLAAIGFDFSFLGKNTIAINGVPAEFTDLNPVSLFNEMVQNYRNIGDKISMSYHEKIALSLAKASSIHSKRQLNPIEQKDLFFRLMSCKNHNFTPDGKKIIEIVAIEEIEKKLS